MPYVKVKELLAMGKKNNACVLAFDAADVNMIKSVIKGAETAGRPVIVMLYPGMRNIMPFGVFAEVTRYYAERASVPVGLHLDHCSDFDMILEAVHEGFPSVMADGSVLPFEENAAFTKKVVEVARNFDVDVEVQCRRTASGRIHLPALRRPSFPQGKGYHGRMVRFRFYLERRAEESA